MSTPTLPGRIAYGVDANGAIQPLAIEADGSLKSSATLSGDVTAATEFAADAASQASDKGIQALAVRRDADTTLVGTTGDYSPMLLDATGYLKVNVKAGTVTANLSATDNTVLDNIDSATSRLTSSASTIGGADSLATTMLLAGGVYNSTPPTVANTKQVALQTDSSGFLKVNVAAGASSGGTSTADDADFTAGSTAGTQIQGVYESSPSSVTDGDVGQVGITQKRGLKVVPVDANGAPVYPVADPADDADFTAGSTVGSPVMGVYESSPTSVTDGDMGVVGITVDRRMCVNATGSVAHDAADANNPVKIGGKAASSAPSAVSAGDRVNAYFDLNGRLVTINDSASGVLADDSAFTPATTPVQMVGFEADEATTDSVDEGDGGAARMTLDRKVIVQPQPHTIGGLSCYTVISDGTDLLNIKGSAGQVYGWFLQNAHATNVIYFKLFNHVDAPDPSGDSADVLVNIGLQPKTAANVALPFGLAFSAGIGISITTGQATTDETAVGAGDAVANIFYK